MELLRCKLCRGECEIVGNDYGINKKIKCLQCGYTNDEETKSPEVFVIRKRPVRDDP